MAVATKIESPCREDVTNKETCIQIRCLHVEVHAVYVYMYLHSESIAHQRTSIVCFIAFSIAVQWYDNR